MGMLKAIFMIVMVVVAATMCMLMSMFMIVMVTMLSMMIATVAGILDQSREIQFYYFRGISGASSYYLYTVNIKFTNSAVTDPRGKHQGNAI
jgi:membrane protein implicated in regulation of membrane protease activity